MLSTLWSFSPFQELVLREVVLRWKRLRNLAAKEVHDKNHF